MVALLLLEKQLPVTVEITDLPSHIGSPVPLIQLGLITKTEEISFQICKLHGWWSYFT